MPNTCFPRFPLSCFSMLHYAHPLPCPVNKESGKRGKRRGWQRERVTGKYTHNFTLTLLNEGPSMLTA